MGISRRSAALGLLGACAAAVAGACGTDSPDLFTDRAAGAGGDARIDAGDTAGAPQQQGGSGGTSTGGAAGVTGGDAGAYADGGGPGTGGSPATGGASATGGVAGAPCSDDHDRCGDACVDTETSPAHCGECDATCLPGAACSDGQCAPALSECGSAQSCDELCMSLERECVAGGCDGYTGQTFADYGCGSLLSAFASSCGSSFPGQPVPMRCCCR